MLQTYRIFIEGPHEVRMDDALPVRELVRRAFEETDYYEPMGMDAVTIFSAHDPRDSDGWFVRDTSRPCAEQLPDREWLWFAYQKPGLFYYAEGGWGHHMIRLGNHPELEKPVSFDLRFRDFKGWPVIAGRYSLADVISFLRRYTYLPPEADRAAFWELPNGANDGFRAPPRRVIPFGDAALRRPLAEMREELSGMGVVLTDERLLRGI